MRDKPDYAGEMAKLAKQNEEASKHWTKAQRRQEIVRKFRNQRDTAADALFDLVDMCRACGFDDSLDAGDGKPYATAVSVLAMLGYEL